VIVLDRVNESIYRYPGAYIWPPGTTFLRSASASLAQCRLSRITWLRQMHELHTCLNTPTQFLQLSATPKATSLPSDQLLLKLCPVRASSSYCFQVLPLCSVIHKTKHALELSKCDALKWLSEAICYHLCCWDECNLDLFLLL
jgi:hypothetical protein